MFPGFGYMSPVIVWDVQYAPKSFRELAEVLWGQIRHSIRDAIGEESLHTDDLSVFFSTKVWIVRFFPCFGALQANSFFLKNLPQCLITDAMHNTNPEDVFPKLFNGPSGKRTAQEFWGRQCNLHNIGTNFGHKFYRPTAPRTPLKECNTFTIEPANQLTDIFLMQASDFGYLLYGITMSRMQDDLCTTKWCTAFPAPEDMLNTIAFSHCQRTNI